MALHAGKQEAFALSVAAALTVLALGGSAVAQQANVAQGAPTAGGSLRDAPEETPADQAPADQQEPEQCDSQDQGDAATTNGASGSSGANRRELSAANPFDAEDDEATKKTDLREEELPDCYDLENVNDSFGLRIPGT